MSYTVEQPIQYTPDPSKFGTLAGGKVWFGVPNGNPASSVPDRIQVYLARQGVSDLPIAQPIDIGPGGVWMYNGSPAQIKVLVPYCVQITNSLGVQKFYSPSAGEEITKFADINAEFVDVYAEMAGKVGYVQNVAAFATDTTSIGNQVCLLGYSSQGSGGGIFDVVSSAGLTADLGHIFIQGPKAYVRQQKKVFLEDFGSGADPASALRAAIKYLALLGGGTVEFTKSAYTFTSTVILPSYIHIDGRNATVTGPGVGSATDVFQSGYLSGTNILSNIGAAPETRLVINSSIRNILFVNTGKALNLYNCVDGCEFINMRFDNCTYAVYADRCFYSGFKNLVSRGSAGGATNAAFYFTDFVNIQSMDSISAGGRILGIKLFGAANAQKLYNCSAENCTVGIESEGATGPLMLDTCYIESNSTTGINIVNAGVGSSVSVANTFINNNGTGIKIDANGIRIYVDDQTEFLNNTVDIDAADDINAFGEINIREASAADNAVANLPTKYSLGKKINVDHKSLIIDSGTGQGLIKSMVHGDTLIPFEMAGDAGSPKSGTVPFCTISFSGGSPFSVYIDTKVVWNKYAPLLRFRLEIADSISTYQIYGDTYGDTVKQEDTSGKTVTISNAGGFVRFTISTFTHPSFVAGVTGVIRHV